MVDAKKKKVKKPEAPKIDQVFKAPVLVRQATNQTAALGGRCVIQIQATGTPMPKFQWFKNGMPIPGAMAPRYVIPKIRQGDVGIYYCEAKNLAGVTTSKPISIMIVQAQIPDFVIEPKQLKVSAGERLLLRFKFQTKLAPDLRKFELQWFSNDKKIRGANKPELDIKRAHPSLSGTISLKLTLKTNSNAYKICNPAIVHVSEARNTSSAAPAPVHTHSEVGPSEAKNIPAKPEETVLDNPEKFSNVKNEADDAFFDFGADAPIRNKSPNPSPLPEVSKENVEVMDKQKLLLRRMYLEKTLTQIKNYRQGRKIDPRSEKKLQKLQKFLRSVQRIAKMRKQNQAA